jgi:hypothetical protein
MTNPTTPATLPAIDTALFLEPSPYDSDGGHLIGRDPRSLPIRDLLRLSNASPIKAVRAKCIDCSGGSLGEARKCVAWNCPLWAFRMGTNVFRGKGSGDTGSENSGLLSGGF